MESLKESVISIAVLIVIGTLLATLAALAGIAELGFDKLSRH